MLSKDIADYSRQPEVAGIVSANLASWGTARDRVQPVVEQEHCGRRSLMEEVEKSR